MSLPPSKVTRAASSAERLMWITPDRVFYAGLLGTPSPRTQGAVVMYVAMDAPLRIRIGGGEWQSTEVAVVQPYVPYEIATDARHVLNILIEPETVDRARLPALLQACGAVQAAEWAARVRHCHTHLLAQGQARVLQPQDFDLSFSRFLHLFKQEVGAPFRSFRRWKRARSLLHHVSCGQHLVHVALDIGYPDSTHFSHSIRQTFGLKPRDIFAGSRKLRIIGGGVQCRAHNCIPCA